MGDDDPTPPQPQPPEPKGSCPQGGDHTYVREGDLMVCSKGCGASYVAS